MFTTCQKKHEAAFFTKNYKKMIMKKDKNTLPPLKNVHFLGPRQTSLQNVHLLKNARNRFFTKNYQKNDNEKR